MLKFPKHRWCSVKETSAAIGFNDSDTRKVLVEVDAMPQALNADRWELEGRIGSG
jgi:hypothetical protein